jgi:hypothetical protein
MTAGDNVVRQEFRCLECDASDYEKLFPFEAPVLIFNCWKCGSGRGKETQEMIARGYGMRIVTQAVAA